MTLYNIESSGSKDSNISIQAKSKQIIKEEIMALLTGLIVAVADLAATQVIVAKLRIAAKEKKQQKKDK